MVDSAAFDELVGQWLSLRELSTLKRIAVDGKTLKGSKRGEDGKALQLLSAVTHRLRLTVAQREIEEKSNEIPALEPLLESIPRMEGALVTADAMQCQQKAAAYITQQRGADYLIGLKGNQSGILARAQIKLPQEFFPCGHDSGWVKEHGRLTRWRIQRKCVNPQEAGLCGCRQLIAVWRERHYLRGGRVYKEEQEYSYYVSSADPRDYSEAAFLDAMRGHWDAVENGSHYRRDVSMGEDASGISKHPQAHMMASLRNLTLGLFERQKRASAGSFSSWRRKMTPSKAISILSSKK